MHHWPQPHGRAKNALGEGKFDPGEDEYVFIGATSKAYRGETYVEDGILKATGKAKRMFLQTSEGRYEKLDPNKFDAVVLYGSFFHLQTFFSSILRANPAAADALSSSFLRRGAELWLQN